MNAPEILNSQAAKSVLENTTVKVDLKDLETFPRECHSDLLIKVKAKNGETIWYHYQRQLLEIFNYEIARAKIDDYEIRLYNPFAK